MIRANGTRVRIKSGMREFVGRTGTICGHENDGRTTLYRVDLDYPVDIPGVGKVSDDLWAGEFLMTLRGKMR